MGSCKTKDIAFLRFWNNEVLANIDGVHETIAEELGRLTPPKPSSIVVLSLEPSPSADPLL